MNSTFINKGKQEVNPSTLEILIKSRNNIFPEFAYSGTRIEKM